MILSILEEVINNLVAQGQNSAASALLGHKWHLKVFPIFPWVGLHMLGKIRQRAWRSIFFQIFSEQIPSPKPAHNLTAMQCNVMHDVLLIVGRLGEAYSIFIIEVEFSSSPFADKEDEVGALPLSLKTWKLFSNVMVC